MSILLLNGRCYKISTINLSTKLFYHTLVKKLALRSLLSHFFFLHSPGGSGSNRNTIFSMKWKHFLPWQCTSPRAREFAHVQGPGNIMQHITIQPDCQRVSNGERNREKKKIT